MTTQRHSHSGAGMAQLALPLALSLALSSPAWAQDTRFLGKEQVSEALADKAFLYKRPSDGVVFRLQYKRNGTAFVDSRGAQLRYNDQGTWTVKEQGTVCVDWVKAGTNCADYFQDGQRLMRAPARDAAGLAQAAEMTPD